MSVFIVSESTNKLITVLLVKALGFEENPGNEFNTFQVYDPEEKYPKLHKLLESCKENQVFHIVALNLVNWNHNSYGTRYAHNNEAMDDLAIEKKIGTMGFYGYPWEIEFNKTSKVQVHKSLCCYLYQIEQNDSAIMNELRAFQVEYGNWLIEKTPEWSEAKWQ